MHVSLQMPALYNINMNSAWLVVWVTLCWINLICVVKEVHGHAEGQRVVIRIPQKDRQDLHTWRSSVPRTFLLRPLQGTLAVDGILSHLRPGNKRDWATLSCAWDAIPGKFTRFVSTFTLSLRAFWGAVAKAKEWGVWAGRGRRTKPKTATPVLANVEKIAFKLRFKHKQKQARPLVMRLILVLHLQWAVRLFLAGLFDELAVDFSLQLRVGETHL